MKHPALCLSRASLPLFLCALAAFAQVQAAPPEDVIVTSYNLENYLVMDRAAEGKPGGTEPAPKPSEEVENVIRILTEIKPDILGVCEMGLREQAEDLHERLLKAGLPLAEMEYVEGPEERRLALFSRFPIVTRESAPDVPYELNGEPQKVRRGFLDVTIEINPEYRLRMIGAHLKSRRAVAEGEALIRRNEAHLLRERINGILERDPETNLLVYGDFNDTKNEPPIHEIVGARGTPRSLTDLWLRDSVGDRWTHYWQFADVYSRIDYFFANRGLKPEIVESKSYIYRSPYWNRASDHRPIIAAIRPVNAK